MSSHIFPIIKRSLFTIALFGLPWIAAAQNDLGTFRQTLIDIRDILNDAVIPIIIALAIIYFLWGVVQYVIAKGPEDKEQAKNTMIYGLIGLFVIFAVWGLIGLLGGLIGVEPGGDAPGFTPPGT